MVGSFFYDEFYLNISKNETIWRWRTYTNEKEMSR